MHRVSAATATVACMAALGAAVSHLMSALRAAAIALFFSPAISSACCKKHAVAVVWPRAGRQHMCQLLAAGHLAWLLLLLRLHMVAAVLAHSKAGCHSSCTDIIK